MKENRQLILVADDEREIRDIVGLLLKENGFEAVLAEDGAQACAMASPEVDLYILDVNMPGKSGFAGAGEIRERYLAPILLLTAYSGDSDRAVGFHAGADDYLVKPFSNTELILRVKSLLRRAGQYARQYTGSGEKGGAEEGHRIAYRDLVLDLDSQSVEKEGKTIALTYTEFQILLLFLRNRKRIFSPENLYQSVWKEEAVGDGAIMVHIKNLRKKLGDDSRNSRYIKTAWGKGYYAD